MMRTHTDQQHDRSIFAALEPGKPKPAAERRITWLAYFDRMMIVFGAGCVVGAGAIIVFR